jgi:hypothetical protein
MRLTFSLILIIIVFIGCNPNSSSETKEVALANNKETKTTVEPENPIPDNFLLQYEKITDAMAFFREDSFNSFIDDDNGLHVIYNNNGALPQLKRVENLRELTTFILDSGLMIDRSILMTPQFEVLPNVICDSTNFDKQGCFASVTTNNLEQHPWNMDNQYLDQINTIYYTVLNTSNFSFYFSLNDEDWFLTFIDIRTPCSA